MLAAQLGNWGACFSLLQYGDDLAVGKTRFLQGNLLGVDYEKIPLLTPAVLRGDYPSNGAFEASLTVPINLSASKPSTSDNDSTCGKREKYPSIIELIFVVDFSAGGEPLTVRGHVDIFCVTVYLPFPH